MKKTKYILTILMVSLLSFSFQSCDDDDEYWVKAYMDMNMSADNIYLGEGEDGFWIDYDIYRTDIKGVNHDWERILRLSDLDAYLNMYGEFREGDIIELYIESDGIVGLGYDITVRRDEARAGMISIDGRSDGLYTDFMYDLIFKVANSSKTRLYIKGYTNILEEITLDFKFRNEFRALVRQ